MAEMIPLAIAKPPAARIIGSAGTVCGDLVILDTPLSTHAYSGRPQLISPESNPAQKSSDWDHQ